MSALLVGRAFHLPLDSTTKLVLLSFCDHANDDGRGVWASLQQTMIRTSLSRSSVQRALKHLEGHDLIVAHGYRRGGHGKATRWSVNVLLVELVADEVIRAWRAWRDGERTVSWRHPFGRNSVTCDVKGCQWPHETVSPRHPNHQEPSRTEEHSTSHPNPRRPPGKTWDDVIREAAAEAKRDDVVR